MNTSSTNTQGCQELAWDVARGQVPCFMFYAQCHGHHVDQMKALRKANQTCTMLAIRTEHLADDWNELEEAFGGCSKKNATVTGAARFATTADTVRQRNSNRSALCEEIQVCKMLLKGAVNLSPNQAQESLLELITSCPGEAVEVRDCTLKQWPQGVSMSLLLP
jgi:hypothetical protein